MVIMRFPQWIWRSVPRFWTDPSPKCTLGKKKAYFLVPSVTGGWKGEGRWLNISNPVFHPCNSPYLECRDWTKGRVDIWGWCLKMLSTFLWKSKLLEKIFKMLGKTPPPPNVIGLTSRDNKVFFSVKMKCMKSNTLREGERVYAYMCVCACSHENLGGFQESGRHPRILSWLLGCISNCAWRIFKTSFENGNSLL